MKSDDFILSTDAKHRTDSLSAVLFAVRRALLIAHLFEHQMTRRRLYHSLFIALNVEQYFE